MRREDIQLEVPSAVAPGKAAVVGTLVDKWVQVDGSFVATMRIEGRMKLSPAWQQVGADITAPGTFQVAPLYYEVRVNVTAYTSGSAAAALGALDRRTF